MDLQKFLNNYETEIFRKRFTWTMMWCLLLLPVLLFSFFLFSSFHPLHLTSWLSYNAYLLISLKFWLFVFLNVPVMALLVLLNASKFKVTNSIHPRRIDTLWHSLTPLNLVHLLTYTSTFSIISYFTYSSSFRSDVSSTPPPSFYNRLVVSLAMGGVMGMVVVVREVWCDVFVYSFPEINVSKVDRFKVMLRAWVVGVVGGVVRLSVCVHVLLAFIAVPLVDNFFGNYFGFLMSSRNKGENEIDDDSSVYPFLCTQYVYVNMCLFVCLQLYVYVPVVLHNVHFTETIEMVVCKRFEGGGDVSLCDSINNHALPLIRYLGYIDLKNIAKFDAKRRSEIFSLSKPGKRPLYWQAVVKDITTSLQSLIQSIHHSTHPPIIISDSKGVGGGLIEKGGRVFGSGGVLSGSSGGILSSLNQPFLSPNTSNNNNNDDYMDLHNNSNDYNKHNNSDNIFNTSNNVMNNSFNNNIQLFSRKNLNSSDPLFNQSSNNQSIFLNKSNNITNFNNASILFSNNNKNSMFTNNNNIFNNSNTQYSNSPHTTSPSKLRNATALYRRNTPQQQLFNTNNFTYNKTSNIFATTIPPTSLTKKLLGWVAGFRVVSYWMEERVDVKNRMLFAHAQVLVWMVKGLSLLVAHSYDEDAYGVVQGSLVDILVCLLAAYESLNKPLQLNPPNGMVTFVSHEAKVRNCLRNEVKSALYRVTTTFKDTLKSLDFTPEQMSKLTKFRDFEE